MSQLQLAETTCEAHLLGAILHDASVMDAAMEELAPADFSEPSYARIYKAMLDADANGEPIEPITLTTRIPHLGDTIHEIYTGTSGSANSNWYIRDIGKASQRRQFIKITETLLRSAKDPEKNIAEIVDRMAGEIMELSMRGAKEGSEEMMHVIERVIREADTRRHSASHIIGLTTHLPSLNKLTSGLQPGKMYVLAGYPSMGKSAIALNIVRHILGKEKTALFFSLEMSRDEVAQRLTAAEARTDAMRTFEGSLNDQDWGKVTDAAESMRPLANRLVVDDRPGLSPIQMIASARRQRRATGLDLVVVDYLQLMGHHDKDVRASEYRVVTECSKALKGMSKTLKCPVVVLSQLRRPGAQEKGKEWSGGAKTQLPEPTIDMLRSSGQVEQDADVIMFIHKNTLNVAKNRSGPRGNKIELTFKKEYMQFNEKTEREEN